MKWYFSRGALFVLVTPSFDVKPHGHIILFIICLFIYHFLYFMRGASVLYQDFRTYSTSHLTRKDRGWIASDDRRARGLHRWWHGLGYVSPKFMAEEALRVDVLSHSGVKGGPNKASILLRVDRLSRRDSPVDRRAMDYSIRTIT